MYDAEDRTSAAEKHNLSLWQSTMLLIKTSFFYLGYHN